jgi:hypothetical protein
MRKYEPDPVYLLMVEQEAVKFLDELDAAFDQFVTAA